MLAAAREAWSAKATGCTARRCRARRRRAWRRVRASPAAPWPRGISAGATSAGCSEARRSGDRRGRHVRLAPARAVRRGGGGARGEAGAGGDYEQLQAIGAGAPFRAIAERIGHAELSDIRRQREPWQRVASVAFASHRTGEGLRAYREVGAMLFAPDRAGAEAAIVRDYLADRERPAHRLAGGADASPSRRAGAQRRHPGRVAEARCTGAGRGGGRAGVLATNDGERRFAPGDRLVFLENDRALGVKNGMLGTVEAVTAGRIVVRLDGAEERRVEVATNAYQALDHGYATTIHKSQGRRWTGRLCWPRRRWTAT